MAARKNSINIDYSSFAEFAERLDELGANLQKVMTDSIEQAAETVQWDTQDAIAEANLPATGTFSRGATEDSLIKDPRVVWSGLVGEIGVGFDITVPGSGGWLITGTPKMRPDYALERIYAQKTYERKLMKEIEEGLRDAIDDILGG